MAAFPLRKMSFYLLVISLFIISGWAVPSNRFIRGVCFANEFKCADGKCIPGEYRCDGRRDCLDRSDEKNCTTMKCDDDAILCKPMQDCMPVRYRCDGELDCEDGSDENAGACNQTCPGDHWKCKSGQCIPERFLCDGTPDCAAGGDDEDDCKNVCREGEFQCTTGRECISGRKVCDGRRDCYDMSDETRTACVKNPRAFKQVCGDSEMKCSNGLCLSLHWACDVVRLGVAIFDCPNGEDEADSLCKPNESSEICLIECPD